MVELEFIPRDGGDTLTIPDDAISSLNATLTNTGVGTFRATIKGDRRLEDRAKVQDRVNINTNDTKFAGYLTNVSQSRASGDTQLRGKGVAKKLQEGRPDYQSNGGPIVYDNVFAGDAIEDYWSRTAFNNVDVTKQSGDISESAQVQSADTEQEWRDILDLSGNDPIYVENDKLKLAQVGFVAEAEATGGVDRTDVEYSGGEAATIEGSGSDSITLTFANEYTIDRGTGEFYVRSQEGGGSGTPATCNVLLDGQTVLNDVIIAGDTTLEWNSVFDTSNPNVDKDLLPGTHTITIEFANANDNVAQIFDVIAFVDNTEVFSFDNTVNEDNGYLDSPRLFPSSVSVATKTTETTRNIAEASVSTTFDDISNNQALAASNNAGDNFTTANNTNSFTADFTTAGRELVSKFTLSAYDNGAQNATPRFDYLGQTVDSFDTTVGLDGRVVFLGVEVSKNHFENLQKLHSNSDYIWTIDHDSSDVATMPVFSFPRGEETRSSAVINDNEIDESPEVSGEQFYNQIPLQGGLDSNGDRPFAEVESQTSINNVGDAISPGLLRDPTISSDIEAKFIARALLEKALKNGELRGQKTIPPTFAPTPGFSYSVSWLDDADVERVLEEVAVTKSTDNAQTVLDFTRRAGFAQEIDELRRNARETSDEV